MVGALALGLLWCSVGRGSVRYSQFRYLGPINTAVFAYSLVFHQFCKAKIEYLYLPRLSNHNVAGLYVPMNYVFRMCVGESVGHLNSDRQRAP